MGHSVSEARNGSEAVSSIARKVPDLMITDIAMPEMDGLETIREIRRYCSEVKIVAISGGGVFEASDYLKLARLFGADRVLTKPFLIEELVMALTELCSPDHLCRPPTG